MSAALATIPITSGRDACTKEVDGTPSVGSVAPKGQTMLMAGTVCVKRRGNMLNWFCRHRKIAPSQVGQGTYRCSTCNKPFASTSQAGILQLDEYERQLSLDRVVRLEDQPNPPVEFAPRAFKLYKGNRLIKEEKLA